MSEYTCETCQRELSDKELYHKYEDVVECDDCRQYILHDMGKTGA